MTGAPAIPYPRAVAAQTRTRIRFTAVLGLLAVLAACAGPADSGPKGPFASPTPAPAQRVINQGCANAAHEGPEATDIGFMQSALLRQEADLQRVSDDVTGAVPGGDLATDAPLAQANAKQVVDLVTNSTLCSPFREDLATAARGLAAKDDALAAAAGGGDVATALQDAQAALAALKAIADHPPSPGAAASPAPSPS